ncbi:MAG TPA: cyclic dehypoxanthinyl futalosine synthase [bacterium]|nr:cyclic dehypoxanthinyl futalosine synthase [bacterium]
MTTATLETLQEKVLDGHVVNREEALALYQGSELNDLGAIADTLKVRSRGDKIATYLIDRNINYTNVCVTVCKFCAFYREPGSQEGYVHEADKIVHKITEAKEKGCTQILLQGGHHPDLTLDWYLNMLSKIKKSHPDVTLHAFSPSELVHFSEVFRMPVREILVKFREAGMDSMPGGGAEILVDRVRKEIAPLKANTEEWLGVMRELHGLGMKSTATMMFGHVETVEERVEHIFRIRELQEETGGFLGFIPWLYQPGNESLGLKSASGQEYLKTLALARVILNHCLPNLQASWVTPGKKIGQLGLKYGANDLGSIMLEENVVASTGLRYLMSVDEMRRLITEMGYEPHQRDTFYNLVN